jgi:hypothetical protein
VGTREGTIDDEGGKGTASNSRPLDKMGSLDAHIVESLDGLGGEENGCEENCARKAGAWKRSKNPAGAKQQRWLTIIVERDRRVFRFLDPIGQTLRVLEEAPQSNSR